MLSYKYEWQMESDEMIAELIKIKAPDDNSTKCKMQNGSDP